MPRKRPVLRSQWLKTRVSLLTPGTCPCTSWVGGGSALRQRSLCFRACLSRTLLAAAAEGKEKPDWVGTGVKCPSWGLFSQSPGPTQPQSREERSCWEPGRRGPEGLVLESLRPGASCFPPDLVPSQVPSLPRSPPWPPGPWEQGGRDTRVPMFPPRLGRDFVRIERNRPGRTAPS